MKAKERIYYIRSFHGDILQIITYRKVTSSKRNHFAFEIYGGIVSLYRKKIDFESSPETWLRNLVVFYTFSTPSGDYDSDLAYELMTFHYDNQNVDNAQKCITFALDTTYKYIISAFDNMKSLDDCIEYFYDFQFDMTLAEYDDFSSNPLYCVSEGLLLVLADYKGDCRKWIERDIKRKIDSIGKDANTDTIQKICKEEYKKKIELRNKIQDNYQIRELFLSYAFFCKEKNYDYISNKYKIII